MIRFIANISFSFYVNNLFLKSKAKDLYNMVMSGQLELARLNLRYLIQQN